MDNNKSLTPEEELTKTKKELGEALEMIKGQEATIAEHEATISGLRSSPSANPTFVNNKKTYEVTTPAFQYQKVQYTVQQLLVDKDLQDELLKKKMGFIVEVVKPETKKA